MNSALAFLVFASFCVACCSIPLIYEGVPLLDRLQVIKAAEGFVESIEKDISNSINNIIKKHEKALNIDISKIDVTSEATEFVYVITKIGENASSYLIAPLAIPETVINDTQEIANTFIEIVFPKNDGTEPDHEIEAPLDSLATNILERFTHVDIPNTVSEEVRKSLESIQEALVYPSAFLKDLEESIPIQAILGLFHHVEREEIKEKDETKRLNQENKKRTHSDEM